MKIQHSVYIRIIFESPCVPPESGGIIGGAKNLISQCEFDSGMGGDRYDQYFPNINKLSNTINQWQKIGIEFYGIYHSHFPKDLKLSCGDQKYITKIMLAMPEEIDTLFFPIVFPREAMIVYRADRYGNRIHIVHDKLRII